jgi:predicted DNA-binding transcriptional regulator YafY
MKKDYDKKLFRLIKILNVLQEAKKTNTADLAAEFNISRRTAQRDIGRLIIAGFPIIEDELQKGVYRFFAGYSLKGLSVSDEEVSLLVSLCDVARHMGGDFAQAYKNIFAKVMNTGEWDSPYFVMMPKAAKAMANADFLKTAEAAINAKKRVRMIYETIEKELKEFVLEPLKLIYYEGYWYLASRMLDKEWIIKNRLDRIKELEVLGEGFQPPKNLQKILQDSHSIWFTEKRDLVVRIKVAAEVALFFEDRSYFPLQKIVKRNKDGSIVLETKLCHYMEAIPSINRWIPHLTVLSPKELSDQIKTSVSSYLKTL